VLIVYRAFFSLWPMARSASDAGENLAMGRRVKDARRRVGLSQQRLAAMIDTSQSCISLWENGVNGASIACFFQLADALQVDARWLATGA
jgi:ribosome-binding protein aMBF1 (putative translation factor)